MQQLRDKNNNDNTLTQTYLRDKTKKDSIMCQTILNMFHRGDLRKDHPQQRKADNWDNQTRDGFIATAIKQEDVNPVIICEQLTDTGVTLWLIDGLQRLTTLDKYKKGFFKLGRSIEFPIIVYQSAKVDKNGNFIKNSSGNIVYEYIKFDLRGKGYKDLPEQLRERFDNYQIEMVKHLDCTDKEIGYHIRRYNHQKPMNICQRSITYMDTNARLVKNISENHRFFKDCGCYTLNEKKNGSIDRIIIESLMGILFLDKWRKQSKSMAKYINENATEEHFDYLSSLLNRLKNIVDKDISKLFNVKNTFIFITVFHRFTSYGIPDVRFADFLRKFDTLKMKPIDGVTFDEIDNARSSKEKRVVTGKIHILETLLNEFLRCDIPIANALNEVANTSVSTATDLNTISTSDSSNTNTVDNSSTPVDTIPTDSIPVDTALTDHTPADSTTISSTSENNI